MLQEHTGRSLTLLELRSGGFTLQLVSGYTVASDWLHFSSSNLFGVVVQGYDGTRFVCVCNHPSAFVYGIELSKGRGRIQASTVTSNVTCLRQAPRDLSNSPIARVTCSVASLLWAGTGHTPRHCLAIRCRKDPIYFKKRYSELTLGLSLSLNIRREAMSAAFPTRRLKIAIFGWPRPHSRYWWMSWKELAK